MHTTSVLSKQAGQTSEVQSQPGEPDSNLATDNQPPLKCKACSQPQTYTMVVLFYYDLQQLAATDCKIF